MMDRLPESVEAVLIAVNDGAQSVPAIVERLDIPEAEVRARLAVLLDYGLIDRMTRLSARDTP